MRMERGFRGKLDDYLSVDTPFQVKINTVGGAVYDTCCFCVDANEKLSDDRYMVFYNQPVSPGQEITYTAQGNAAEYAVQLTRLPAAMEKLVFTVSIDGSGTMGQIRSNTIQIVQNGQTVLETELHGSDFQNEKAIIGIEIYRKTVWRISLVARGFNGGLGDLLRSCARSDTASGSCAAACTRAQNHSNTASGSCAAACTCAQNHSDTAAGSCAAACTGQQ